MYLLTATVLLVITPVFDEKGQSIIEGNLFLNLEKLDVQM